MTPFLEPLSPEEEKYYLEQYRKGDKKAKDVLIERNMRLVAHVVRKYICSEREMEELISVGTIGLIKAVQTFEASKGNKLVTYAAKCIDNELLMMIRGEKKKAKDVSLYEPVGTDKEGNAIRLMDMMESEDPDMADECDRRQKIRWLKEAMGRVLKGREYEIICMRYGLDGKKEKTQREVAERFHISRSYVSRLEKKAIEKMRADYEKRT